MPDIQKTARKAFGKKVNRTKNNRAPKDLATLRTAAIFGNHIFFLKYSRKQNYASALAHPNLRVSAHGWGESGERKNRAPKKYRRTFWEEEEPPPSCRAGSQRLPAGKRRRATTKRRALMIAQREKTGRRAACISGERRVVSKIAENRSRQHGEIFARSFSYGFNHRRVAV